MRHGLLTGILALTTILSATIAHAEEATTRLLLSATIANHFEVEPEGGAWVLQLPFNPESRKPDPGILKLRFATGDVTQGITMRWVSGQTLATPDGAQLPIKLKLDKPDDASASWLSGPNERQSYRAAEMHWDPEGKTQSPATLSAAVAGDRIPRDGTYRGNISLEFTQTP
jgi:hypothetical protein